MRSDRLLVSGAALLALAFGALLLFVSGSSGGAARDVFALSPTPQPFSFDWSVEVTGDAVEGGTINVHADAVPIHSGGTSGAQISEPVFNLSVDSDAVEIAGPADVSRIDISEGADWKLYAQHPGEVTLTIRVDYLLSYNITGTPPGSYHASSQTTEEITISGALAPNGDVNGDGTTNSIDAFLLLQFTAGLILPPVPNGDVNMDGATNSMDAALILQFDAHLVPILPQLSMPDVDVPPVTAESGLVIYNIRDGTGTMARTNDTVTVNYTGWLENGVMIASSIPRGQPAQFLLTDLIQGLQEGVPGMTEGGLRRLVIPPDLAYGAEGFPPVIAPNSTLVFDIALISVP